MMNKSIGFIGGGRVTRILLQGFRNKKITFERIAVTDTNPDVTVKLKEKFPEVESSDPKTAARQEIVFIALHPPVVMDMLELLKDEIRSESIIISLAPKDKFAKIINETGSCH